LFSAFQMEYPQIVKMIRDGILTDKDKNILSKIMEHHSAFKRYNPEIFDENPQFIGVSPQTPAIRDLNYLENDEKQKEVKTFTHLLCVDLNTVTGLSTVLTALQHLVIILTVDEANMVVGKCYEIFIKSRSITFWKTISHHSFV
jgi:hypothetical protein